MYANGIVLPKLKFIPLTELHHPNGILLTEVHNVKGIILTEMSYSN